jgi:hypothetical protein
MSRLLWRGSEYIASMTTSASDGFQFDGDDMRYGPQFFL